jgi:hypothetical protein
MRRPFSDYDFVDFVTFTLAAMAFVIAERFSAVLRQKLA